MLSRNKRATEGGWKTATTATYSTSAILMDGGVYLYSTADVRR